MSGLNTHLTIAVPQELKENLKRAARKRHLGHTQLARLFIIDGLSRYLNYPDLRGHMLVDSGVEYEAEGE